MGTAETRIQEAEAFALEDLAADVQRLREDLERITGIEAPMVILDPRDERVYIVAPDRLLEWLNAAKGQEKPDD